MFDVSGGGVTLTAATVAAREIGASVPGRASIDPGASADTDHH